MREYEGAIICCLESSQTEKKSFTEDDSDLCGFWHIQDRGSRLNRGSSTPIVFFLHTHRVCYLYLCLQKWWHSDIFPLKESCKEVTNWFIPVGLFCRSLYRGPTSHLFNLTDRIPSSLFGSTMWKNSAQMYSQLGCTQCAHGQTPPIEQHYFYCFLSPLTSLAVSHNRFFLSLLSTSLEEGYGLHMVLSQN